MKWYIDAWAAVDGRAFASWRPAEDPKNPVVRSGAGAFLAAPHFEPEWTTSPSTALTATRGLFQWGFYDTQKNEIPFDTLNELRELVRRIYVAGGAGGQAPDGTVPPEPMRPSLDDIANLPEGPGELDGEKEAAEALAKHLSEADPVRRREHVTGAILTYLRTARHTRLIPFVADVLLLAARHPDPQKANTDMFREWALSIAAWAAFLAIIAKDPRTAATILEQASKTSKHHSPIYDRILEIISDMLTGWRRHSPYPYPWHLGVLPGAERKAPLVTLPRYLPLPRRERDHLPKWANNLADSVCIICASYQQTRTLANSGNISLVVGSSAAMVLCSLLTIADSGYPAFLDFFSTDNLYDEELFREIAAWTSENIVGPELEANIRATFALEEYVADKVGTYHATP